tara:strand:+ start:31 stop:375 length:345 start_codon:yes stop_codon:yes gene_type:complete
MPNSKEYMKVYNKQYHKKNREKHNQQMKQYRQTEAGKKSHRISNWKYNGLKHDNYDELYEYYLNCKNCEKCNVELTYDKQNTSTTKCMDHSHRNGQFRNILCNSCNTKRLEDNF